MSNLLTEILQKARSVSERVYFEIALRVASEEKQFDLIWPLVDSVEGFLVSPWQERWLFETARSVPDDTIIVEIGSFKGRSTCCLGFGCRGTKKRLFAIDTFEGNEVDFQQRHFFGEFSKNMNKCGLAACITPIQGWSHEIAKSWTMPIHMLFIDGSHRYEDVLKDFFGFFPHVVPGGIVAVHDVVETWPGSLQAWHGDIKHHLSGVGYCSTLGYGTKPSLLENR